MPERAKDQRALEGAALRLYLRHLRDEGEVPPPPKRDDSSPVAAIKARYVDFLRHERGLTEQSIKVYSPLIEDFLTAWVDRTGSGSAGAWEVQFVVDFLLHHARDRSSEYTRLLAATLRSFLRFLFLRGETATDLSPSVPMVRRWREATVPAFLSSQEVERTLSSTDPSTARGRRDHAILLLLARLGLRAGEVVALELGDIRWRTAQLCVRGKGRVRDQLPLLSEVGEALALYLRMDRGKSPSRRVFLRIIAPRIGLKGPAAVGHVVRRAFARAAVHPTSRGAAHLFRHSLATRMLRQGASMAEIAEILRHRSRITTAIYAKVDFEVLREVAGSWPGTGGVR
jgi:site-specific recombinase XerD